MKKSVRESKKERAAYEEQMQKDAESRQGNGEGDEDADWGMRAMPIILATAFAYSSASKGSALYDIQPVSRTPGHT